MNPALSGQAELLEHIVYSENGQELSLILPWAKNNDRTVQPRHPLILFVQGSSWTTPNLGYEIPMLSHYAEEGYAVATIQHRSARDGHPFPAFLIDAKCAIRFLRANARKYGLDTEHIVAFGTSSGGNTVCLLGLTGDDPELRSDEYAEYSDAVQSVISCFAPTDLPALFEFLKDIPYINEIKAGYFGPDPALWDAVMRKYSPVYRVEDNRAYPPFLLLHGTGDTLVPCSQLDALYIRLKTAGVETSACYVTGAEHEGNFWTPEIRSLIHDEIVRRLAK